MEGQQLPFGRTQASQKALKQVVDIDGATEILEINGVSRPSERIELFVEQVPGLLEWLERYGREYPWRSTTDPWKVYISEILLQRTRGDAVARIYADFFDQFPTPEALYHTSEADIFETVSSLGFGSQRTRTLQEVAELCYIDHDGKVPRDIEELKRPWRVGPYSASACLIFAFGEARALVDSNIARIIERVFAFEMPSQPHKSELVYSLMENLIPSDPGLARALNLALIDLGALICTPKNPECTRCPLAESCDFYDTSSE